MSLPEITSEHLNTPFASSLFQLVMSPWNYLPNNVRTAQDNVPGAFSPGWSCWTPARPGGTRGHQETPLAVQSAAWTCCSAGEHLVLPPARGVSVSLGRGRCPPRTNRDACLAKPTSLHNHFQLISWGSGCQHGPSSAGRSLISTLRTDLAGVRLTRSDQPGAVRGCECRHRLGPGGPAFRPLEGSGSTRKGSWKGRQRGKRGESVNPADSAPVRVLTEGGQRRGPERSRGKGKLKPASLATGGISA